MKNNDFLLSDETNIDLKDFKEREKVYNFIKGMPMEFFSKMRHFQPQIGCLNACKICSKYASTNTSFWTIRRQRNIIAALKRASLKYRKEKPYIVWDRAEHRSGVIFSYLDNDIGNYYYLDSFIQLCYDELGVQTRISTVGYSRYNNSLNEMHKRINSPSMLKMLGGVRLSFTPYELGWVCPNNKKYSRKDYIEDIANFLKIYKPYYEYAGSGSRDFCVELRYKPLVVIADVYAFEYKEHMVISTKNYLYISKAKNIELKEAKIADPFKHSIVLDQKPEQFFEINLDFIPNERKDLERWLDNIDLNNANYLTVDLFKMKNREGEYYSINPSLSKDGNKGINIYPKTNSRKKSGYIVVERFLLNAIFKFKKNHSRISQYTWNDVNCVLTNCEEDARYYKTIGKNDKSEYILKELLPLIEAYISALKIAEYSPSEFFNADFTIDTGIICNLGRAITEFGGLTNLENEPLTPTHERNYGIYNSKMTQEGVAWRLSCEYGEKILVEELSLKETATLEGQVKKEYCLQLDTLDEKETIASLNEKYLIPGQVNNEKIYFYKEFGDLGYLASYSSHGFEKDGIYWKTLEHYYQAQKFEDKNVVNKIINAKTPKEASTIGRDRNNKLKSDWNKIKLNVMEDGLYYKYIQNDDICKKLLATGNKEIVEATVKENYWGCGPDGMGQNNFGKLLMKVRDRILREQSGL